MSRGPSAKSRGRLCAVSRKTGVGTLRAARRADACALQRCSKTIARRRRRRVGTTTCVGQDRRGRECVRDGMNASVCFGKFPRRFRAVVAISRCVFMTELGKQPKRDRLRLTKRIDRGDADSRLDRWAKHSASSSVGAPRGPTPPRAGCASGFQLRDVRRAACAGCRRGPHRPRGAARVRSPQTSGLASRAGPACAGEAGGEGARFGCGGG